MSPTERTSIIKNTCAKCGHQWLQRKDKKSERCPDCGTTLWDNAPHDAEVERVKAAVESLEVEL